MKKFQKSLLSVAVVSAATGFTSLSIADEFTEALTSGKAYGDFRLRYEAVDQDNALKDADGLTLRSRIGYTTGTFNGLSATIEVEDSRVVAGAEDFNAAGLNNNGTYSVIADPETTELDQGYIQYKTDSLTLKAGRQVITYDGHRFVGHVGWRQDRQTFDGFTLQATPAKGLTINYGFIDERNRIFAEDRDIDSKDHLFNVSYDTAIGKLVGYSYLLEDEDADVELDTYGASLTGAADISEGTKLLYSIEYATQENETTDIDTDYMLVEAGVAVSGITAKLGYEVLGSDDGMGGFATPLATLHKFNGWADQFLATPAQGLKDAYVSVSGKLAGGAWAVVYHDYEADEDTATIDDFGDEINISYAKKFGKHYSAGIKYAAYDAGDTATGKVDTDKLWVWVGFSF
ncbi:MAG: alginate export family protein [Porticoccaceae bacterium]